jgi:EAL domain-containing protein (putative c-di-GMP-specific phosphodiesterase class I)/CHASE2 domain-containing sensor protein
MALNLNKAKIGRKILLLAAVCGVLGALNFFQPLSLALHAIQTKAAVKPVSGDIVVVGIDSPSINAVGRWPWPRDKQAELIRKIDRYDPAEVYVDIGYQGTTTPAADNALRTTLENMNAPTKVIALVAGRDEWSAHTIFSTKSAVGSVEHVSAHTPYLFGFVWHLSTSVPTERGLIPSAAASMAKYPQRSRANFAIDYTYDPNTVPVYAAKDVLNQTIKSGSLRGKIVILGTTDPTQHDVHSMPGWGEQPGVLVHALGAETLKDGFPSDWGWLFFFASALIICLIQLTEFAFKYSKPLVLLSAFAILGCSTWLTTLNIRNDPIAALVMITCVGILVSRQKAALVRSHRNAETGLFNMTGYMIEEVVSNAVFIGATLVRAETRLGYVRQQDEMAIMKEVGHRLSTVIDEQQLTHNERQQFLWEMPNVATHKLADHLEGLRQLFAEPIMIDGRKIDIDIHFGVDRNVNKNIRSRMESALAASVEASKSQSTFTIATTIEFDTLLRSHFSSEFDTAINNGDIELALEAQENLGDHRVHSAAASLRWTHPAYGQINTAKLFAIARTTGNLKTVSLFLCTQAIMAAGQLAKGQPSFRVCIKISIEIILAQGFGAEMFKLTQEAGCQPSNITFEVIDLHDHKYNESAHKALQDLQIQGFRVGIGNFGTTDADIDFIKRFQPDEIFLAKSFSAEFLGSTSNEIFAVGALRIAKANHIITTADGIDDRDVLAALRRHGCDRGRGKIISIPLNLFAFLSTCEYELAKKSG